MEIYHDYGNDIPVGADGDLMKAEGETLSNQRIVRRLLTTPITVSTNADYIDHPDYGAGLPQFIGQLNTPENFAKASGLITSQMFLEETVAQTPPPVIDINGLTTQVNTTITYTYLITNQQLVITVVTPS